MGKDGTLNYHLIADAEIHKDFIILICAAQTMLPHDSLHISVVASFSTEVCHDKGHICLLSVWSYSWWSLQNSFSVVVLVGA